MARADGDGGDAGPVLGPVLAELASLAGRTADELATEADRYAAWARETLAGGGKLIFCGNGGSAATAGHVAAEYRVRFRRVREPLPAVCLTAGTAALTAAANDFGFEEVFARGLRALGRPGDLLVLHSTSGRSPNVLRAAETAREMGIRTVGLTGAGGEELAGRVDLALVVPSDATARVQEIHLAIEHAVAERLDAHFADAG